MLKHSIAVAALLLGAADALQTMKISSDASGMSRRDAIIGVAPAAFFGFGLSQGASPALALRSVLDDGSQQLFDEKQAKRNAPPPPPKTMQVRYGNLQRGRMITVVTSLRERPFSLTTRLCHVVFVALTGNARLRGQAGAGRCQV